MRAALPVSLRDGDIVEGYHQMLNDPDPSVRQRAAFAWCAWESAAPDRPPMRPLSGRFADAKFAMAYARLVTHYVRHNAWIEDQGLLRNVDRIAHQPGIIVIGRFDFRTPIGWAWDLTRAWPRAKLVVVNDAGHVLARQGNHSRADPRDQRVCKSLNRGHVAAAVVFLSGRAPSTISTRCTDPVVLDGFRDPRIRVYCD